MNLGMLDLNCKFDYKCNFCFQRLSAIESLNVDLIF
jgi:hypothetical protein